MKIRESTDADQKALVAMHRAQGFDYPFPDLRDPNFISKVVLEDESGEPAMAALARLTCEMYLLADPVAGRPRERFARLLELHRAGANQLRARGLRDVHAWRPPRIAHRLGRRLAALGWIRDDTWTSYCKRLR